MPNQRQRFKRWRRRLALGALCVLLDITIGVALGALIWGLVYVASGNSLAVSAALKGRDLDALDHLEAVVVIGGLMGCLVGLVHACLRDEPVRG